MFINKISTENFKNLLLVVLIVFIIGQRYQLHQAQLNLTQVDKIDVIRPSVLKDGTKVASNEIKQTSRKDLKNLSEKDSRTKQLYKSFHSVEQIEKRNTTTKYDSIGVQYPQKVQYNFSKIGSFENKLISYDYKSTQDGFEIKNFKSYDSITRVIGVKRKWLFGKETYEVSEIHSNPNVISTQASTFEISQPTPFYRTRVAFVIYGLILAKVIK